MYGADVRTLRVSVRSPDGTEWSLWEKNGKCQDSKVLSRRHTKRRIGAHGRAHPSFGVTLTF